MAGRNKRFCVTDESMPRVMAVDPGTHTGVAWWNGWMGWEEEFAAKQSRTYVAVEGGAKGSRPVFGEIEGIVRPWVKLVEALCVDVLVVEDFVLRQGADGRSTVKSSDPRGMSPARVGAIMACEAMELGVEVVFQQPAEMSALTNDRLRMRGVWVPDGAKGGAEVGESAEHRRDAWRHVLVWLTKNKMKASWI